MVVSATDYEPRFLKLFEKIKDPVLKIHIKKQIAKIINEPEIGKPMMYGRKGTRELYVGSFRLSYLYLKEKDKIIFLDIYHKDEQ